MKVGFIGLGNLGKDAAEVISQHYDLEGFDIKEIDTTVIQKDLDTVCKDKEIIFIAVPTPHDPLYDGKEPTSHLPPKDFNYEIAKLFQFIYGNYDQIMSNNYLFSSNNYQFNINIYNTDYQNLVRKLFLCSSLKNKFFTKVTKDLIKILYLSMIPNHEESKERQLIFLLTSLII